jgi:hypothetical protein
VAVWIEIKKKQPPYTMELVSVFPIFFAGECLPISFSLSSTGG